MPRAQRLFDSSVAAIANLDVNSQNSDSNR